MAELDTPIASADGQPDWIILVVKVPATPSRHRVAVWRELRRSGAVPLGQGIWAIPDVPSSEESTLRIQNLVDQGEGGILILSAHGRSQSDADHLLEMFSRARKEEWTEFLTECDHFDAEIAKEIQKNKLTMAELEEEDQSLDRLRRWHSDITRRDIFGDSASNTAATRLQQCTDRLDEYAQLVHTAAEEG